MAGASGIAGIATDSANNSMKQFMGWYQFLTGMKGLKNLKQPQYMVNKNIIYNKNFAGQIASEGLPSSVKNFAGDAIDRNLGSTINAYTSTGQGLNAIAGAQQGSNNAFQQLLMADAMQKSRNREVLMNANKDLAEENFKAFNWNSAMPWELDYNKFSNMTNSGMLNLTGGNAGQAKDAFAAGDLFSNSNNGGGNKMGDTSGGSSFGDQSGFQQYGNTQNLNLGGNNSQYGLPNYSWSPNNSNQQDMFNAFQQWYNSQGR